MPVLSLFQKDCEGLEFASGFQLISALEIEHNPYGMDTRVLTRICT